jgi:hypothetical protein
MSYFKPEPFTKVLYFENGGKGDADGRSPDHAAAMIDNSTLWAIPQYSEIKKVSVIIDTAVAGTTDIDIGDADNADGFVDGSGSLTLGTPGIYSNNAKVAGAYLRVETAGATDAADIYVVPTSKYYTASGKYIAADFTGTSSAGKLRVVIEGVYHGANP